MLRHLLSLTLVATTVSSHAACSFSHGPRLYVSGSKALDRGEIGRAIADLEEASRFMPESSEVQNHLGIAYEQAGRSEDAHRAWKRAVALDCSNQEAAKNLRDFERTAAVSGEAGPEP